MSTSWYIHGVFMNDTWTSEQDKLVLAQTICNLYK